MNGEVIKLTVQRGKLCLDGSELLVRYPEGDCDSIPWPLDSETKKDLESALFDARETGKVPYKTESVLLPDDSAFSF